jgi:hypothetical protein
LRALSAAVEAFDGDEFSAVRHEKNHSTQPSAFSTHSHVANSFREEGHDFSRADQPTKLVGFSRICAPRNDVSCSRLI